MTPDDITDAELDAAIAKAWQVHAVPTDEQVWVCVHTPTGQQLVIAHPRYVAALGRHLIRLSDELNAAAALRAPADLSALTLWPAPDPATLVEAPHG